MNESLTINELMTINEWNGRYISAIGLIPIINQLQTSKIKMLEIGTCRAENACKFLECCPSIYQLDTVDPFLPFMDNTGGISETRIEHFKKLAIANLAMYGSRAKLHTLTSEAFFEKQLEVDYDVVFIDGNHDYEFVLRDIANAYQITKQGGIFAGHDWSLAPVRAAVNEFRSAHNIQTPINYVQNDVWFWNK